MCVVLHFIVSTSSILNRAMLADFSGGQKCTQAFGVVLMRTQVMSGMTCGGISYLMKTGTNGRSQRHGDHQQDLNLSSANWEIVSDCMLTI